MRARNLKPGFFKNEVLAELDPLGRLLFVGLWCLADREGRLEDRPKRIKAEVLPYDSCDVNKFLSELAEFGFILRYKANGQNYIQIANFTKHQSPHIKEAASTIPAPGQHQTCTRLAPDLHQTSPSDSLNPDVLNPDVLNPERSTPPISPPRQTAPGETFGGSPSGSPRGDSIFSPGLKNDELAEAETPAGNHDPAKKTREKFPESSEIAESAAPAVINSDILPFQNNPEAEPAKPSPAAFAAVEDPGKTETSNFAAAAATTTAAESAGNVLAGAAALAAGSSEASSSEENAIAFPGPSVPAENQSSFSPGLKVPSDGGGDGDDSAAGEPELPEQTELTPPSGKKKKAKPKAAPVPYQEIADAWNENAPENLPRVANLNDKRRRMLKTAWKDHPDIEWWQSYFSDIQYSDWHAGRKEWEGADFEWAVKNRVKLREKLSVAKRKASSSPATYSQRETPEARELPGPEGCTAPNPNCPICGGTGIINHDDGSCDFCECLRPLEELDDPENRALPTLTFGSRS